MRTLFLTGLLLLFFLNASSQVPPPPAAANTADSVKVVEILSAERYGYKKKDSLTELLLLVGKVALKQGNTLFYGDSAVYNRNSKIVEAFKNVHINDNDTINAYSDYLLYHTDTKVAFLKEKVRLTDGKSNLYTDELEYDINQKVGIYRKGGKVVNGTSTLTSREGTYYADLKDVYFKDNVDLVDPQYKLKTDSLLYNTNSEIATFITKTYIEDSAKRTIVTSEGYYDLKNKTAAFGARPIIKDGAATVIADQIDTDDHTGISVLTGNAVYKDTAQGVSLLANYIISNKQTGSLLATQKPLMIIVQDKDSTFVTADTLYSGRLSELVADSIRADSIKAVALKADSIKADSVKKALQKANLLKDSLKVEALKKASAKTDSVAGNVLKTDSSETEISGMDSLSHISLETDSTRTDTLKMFPRKIDSVRAHLLKRDPLKPDKDISDSSEIDTVENALQNAGNPPKTRREKRALRRAEQRKAEAMKADSAKKVLQKANSLKDSLKADELQKAIPKTGAVASDVLKTDSSKIHSVKKALQNTDLPEVDSLRADSSKTDSVQRRKAIVVHVDSITKQPARAPNDSADRFFRAYSHVKIFADSMQAVCDSLFYSGRDSTFRLFRDPIVWSGESQVTGDTIYMQTRNKKPHEMNAFENGLMVNRTGEDMYNQVKGNRIFGYFKDGEIDYVRAKGNAESIYYAKDEHEKLIGINKATSNIIDMRFKNKELNRVVFMSEVQGTMLPFRKATEQDKKLRNFKWHQDRRPKSKFELFGN